MAASNLSSANVVTGRGVAFGRYANCRVAAVADIEVNKKTGKITVKHVFVAPDAGLAIYPDGLREQRGWARSAGRRAGRSSSSVVFDKKRVTSLDWVTYPIMRFKDAPKITLEALSGPTCRSTIRPRSLPAARGRPAPASRGLVPVPPAIANAFFDATGVRIREAPMTPGRVRAVLAAAK